MRALPLVAAALAAALAPAPARAAPPAAPAATAVADTVADAVADTAADTVADAVATAAADTAADAVAVADATAPLAAVAPAPLAAVETVDAVDGECAYEITYDPVRISEARLRKLLRLRQGYAGTWLAEFAAVNALPWLDPIDTVAAAVPRMLATLARFDAEMRKVRPPPELAPVVAWTREDMVFQLWMTRTELAFCRSGDAAVLATDLDGLETPARCAEEIWLVDRSLLGRCQEACRSWGSCVEAVYHDRHGPFPEAAWRAFLDAHGVTVRAVTCDGADRF